MKAFEVCSDKMISDALGIFIFSNLKTVLETEKKLWVVVIWHNGK